MRKARWESVARLAWDRLSEDPGYDPERLAREVLRAFPESRWSGTHHSWYKSVIKSGRMKAPRGAEGGGDGQA